MFKRLLIKIGVWPKYYIPIKCRPRIMYQVCYNKSYGWVEVSKQYDSLAEILEYVPSGNDRYIRMSDPLNYSINNIYRWNSDRWVKER